MPVSAGIITAPVPDGAGDEITAVEVVGDSVFVGLAPTGKVLVYDVFQETYTATIDLAAAAQFGAPTGVYAFASTADSDLVIGTGDNGEVFFVDLPAMTVASRGRFAGNADYADTVERILAMERPPSSSNILVGGRIWNDTGELTVASWNPGATMDTNTTRYLVTNASAVPSYRSRAVRTIAADKTGTYTEINIGIEDTRVEPAGGQLWSFSSSMGNRRRTSYHDADSAITASVWYGSALYYAGMPTGNLYASRMLSNDTVTVDNLDGETVINDLEVGTDTGGVSSIFIASDTGWLLVSTGGAITTADTVTPGFDRISSLSRGFFPDRIYGGANRTGDSPVLFYYDVTGPRAAIEIRLDQDLVQPGTPDPWTAPISRGTYTITVTLTEKISAAPTLRVIFSDASIDTYTMTGGPLAWTATMVITQSDPAGTARFEVVGKDNAGNPISAITSGEDFINRSLANVIVANNFFRPGQGEFCSVRYVLDAPATVTVRIYNLRGRMVRDISPGYQTAGEYDLPWNGSVTGGPLGGSGIYYIRVESSDGGLNSTHKVMMVR